MTAITATKSPVQNRLEGFSLTALLQGLPIYAGVVLMLKLTGSPQIVGHPGGPAMFVTLASFFHAWLTPKLARRFPRWFGHGYEPLFYDASLSFAEKIAAWRIQPKASLELVTSVLLLSLLAVAVASMR